MRILLAVPNMTMARVLERTLDGERHEVTVSSTHGEVRKTLESGSFDLVILDDEMQGMSSTELTSMLKRLDGHTKVLYLTTPSFRKSDRPESDADNDADARWAASEALAAQMARRHDIHASLPKPFSKAQLLSHIALLCGADGQRSSTLISHGDLTLDLAKRQAFYGDVRDPIPLSPREYATLETLIRANGRFLSFDELLEAVFGRGVFEQRDAMEATMYHLMRKLRRAGMYITQRGDMYRIL
ncbi:transcriptional regulator [Bifidobacterium margollesii]|uniref:Transcriptional regulator n=1 Tax=Bifidobacterium margollesii TaxID=2020964 RepID=A0A2N5J7T3_9BIFI|nr:winged helix-turn-helix domain-containing protein [Bifidobacterium margollesii]PLS30266.1 transcriptional regulator [Bifidobacterium margollesii]